MLSIDIKKTLHGANGDMDLEVSFDVKSGEFIALAGKSGSGKTTLLRILAGLEDAQGSISVDGEVWQDENNFLSVQKRGIGFVFQDYALFENMSVEENLLFVRKDKTLCKHLLEITELSTLKHRAITRLSGGQKQRVSLCRAMMNRPKLLLMDEPLSALDPSMRTKLQDEIRLLHKEFNTTTIMVSHDPSEIYKLAERMILLDHGSIIDDASPREILLKTQGSAKFSFKGELLDIKKLDVIYVAIVAIGQQIVEVVLSEGEKENLKVGDAITLSTKAFSPTIKKIKS